ncbi:MULTISPECIES: GNAT family N-acetyltransferase [Zobellia]|uniref:GNAT family N-acetyltransferase n=1 Tax=Zobellia TaxID=112040 RepID=UPI000B5333DF|nr:MULTISPECIES: GNAT family N-acetyltransferase [Zobellia]MBU3027090.1 GNAT family N-acetyltransferase [Zobellia galactanivorans]OWW24879.1 GNAT family N-acetyltransferase [Zobellia sp. OII3]
MLKIERTTHKNEHFTSLVAQLDAYLSHTDGDEHDFYHQYNGIEHLNQVVIAYSDNAAVGCGAIKEFDTDSVEVKRMYVSPKTRGQGVATLLLKELEKWATELGYKSCILETGKRQPEAISLYTKNNYKTIPNYGQYEGMENSVCFKKDLV